MRIGILGTGVVGTTIGSALLEGGDDVCMGSRSATNASARQWVENATAERLPGRATQGTFADAARFGEILFNCTAGVASLDALAAAGAENLSGRILIDVANPLDFSRGMPPTLSVCNDDSLGERIQAAYPQLRVVKTLNTVNCHVMVEPARVPGDHVLFMSGNDAGREAEGSAAARRMLRLGSGERHRPGRHHDGARHRDGATPVGAHDARHRQCRLQLEPRPRGATHARRERDLGHRSLIVP